VGLWSIDPGFNPRNVLTFGYTLPPSMIHGNPEAIRAAYRAFDDKLAATPGIKMVSQSWGGMPLDMDDDDYFWIDGRPKPADTSKMSMTLIYIVGPDYLKMMQIPLKRGRFFTAQDDEKSLPICVIDEEFARKYFPGEDPIGKRIVLNGEDKKLEIVGVAGHVKQWGLVEDEALPLRAQLYTPWMQTDDDFVRMAPSGVDEVVRFTGAPEAAAAAVRRTIGEMSNQQIIYGMQTMERAVSDSLAEQRFVMILLGAFAALALLLASVGIYGVIAYVVGQRTQEIGIRMALGAQRYDVLRLMLWEGVRLALAGVVVGVAAALLLTRLMTRLLYGVSATDPLTFAAVAMLLSAVAVAACYFPARKATRIDPMQALRTE
jgi:predicted permease